MAARPAPRCPRLGVKPTWLRLEMPSTKQMESRMLLLPDPLRPVMALNCGSKPETTVRVA